MITIEQILVVKTKLERQHNIKIVYLGKGMRFKPLRNKVEELSQFYGWCLADSNSPRYSFEDVNNGYWIGGVPSNHYFAPIYSEIARINGHQKSVNVISRTLQL